ncbi:MAG: T9SS type A sorting domain-containing protein, partial [Bacteroidota bacterium]
PIDSLQILFDAQKSCTPSSISETSDIPWRVFPNPTGDKLSLEILASNWNPSTIIRYKLVDNAGRRVAKGAFTGRQTELDLSDLPSGLYILELVTEGVVLQRKVVRK